VAADSAPGEDITEPGGEPHLPAALQAPPHDTPPEVQGLEFVPSAFQLATRGSSPPPVRGAFAGSATPVLPRLWR